MDSISIAYKAPKFTTTKKRKIIKCSLVKVLNIFNKHYTFNATGEARRTQGNEFNPQFGKTLAFIRASKRLDEMIEMFLVKYSFTHMLEKSIWNAELTCMINAISEDVLNVLREELS